MTAQPVITRLVDLYDVPALLDGQTIVKQGGTLAAVDIATQAELDAVTAAAALGLVPTAVKTADYSAAANDFVPVDTSSGNVTITLPTAPADKTRVAAKMVIQAAGHTVAVTCGGGDVFNKAAGSTSLTLTLLNQAVSLQYKASSGIWYVVADDVPLSGLDARFASTGGSLPSLSSGGPPTGTSHTYATNDTYVDVNGVAWQCTAGGAPGTWKFWGTGFFPGITTNDATSGTDYGAVINAYMATLPPYSDTPKLPGGAIFCGTEVIPPLGITLVGNHWTEDQSLLRCTVLRPLNPGMTRVASLSNSQSGMRNLVVDGFPIGSANVATIAFGVYASHCKLDHFSAVGGSITTFDSNNSATSLDMQFFNLSESGGVPSTGVLNVNGSDWIVTAGRTNGPVAFGGGGNLWDAVHFVGQSTGSRTPFTDSGGQTFGDCYFDSIPAAALIQIDRTGASRPSQYNNCFHYQNLFALGATSTVFKETAIAGAGAQIIGAVVRSYTATGTFGYFITGAIASTQVVAAKAALFTLQTAFTDATPPLGFFSGCMSNGALVYLGGTNLGSNVIVKTRDQLQRDGIGVISEPFPASALVSTPSAPVTQNVVGVAIGLKRGDPVTGIMTRLAVAAAGTNPTNVRFGLADSTGKIVALSADRGSAGANDATTVFAAGPNKIPFSGGAYTVPADGLYYPVFVVNGTWGTTQPTMGLLATNGALMAAAAGAAPVNFLWTGQTDLPAVNSSLTITGGSTRSYYLAAY